MHKKTFRQLGIAAILVALMAAAGSVLVLGSERFRLGEEEALKAAQAKLSEVRTRLSRVRQEEQEIKDKIALFNELKVRGILGEEDRLNWVEQVRRIKLERKLYDVQYEISPQRALSEAMLSGASGSFEFYSSPMQLRMEMLHEGDLLDLLADLGVSARAHVRATRCAIARLPALERSSPPAPRLSADCVLELITARERRSEQQ